MIRLLQIHLIEDLCTGYVKNFQKSTVRKQFNEKIRKTLEQMFQTLNIRCTDDKWTQEMMFNNIRKCKLKHEISPYT